MPNNVQTLTLGLTLALALYLFKRASGEGFSLSRELQILTVPAIGVLSASLYNGASAQDAIVAALMTLAVPLGLTPRPDAKPTRADDDDDIQGPPPLPAALLMCVALICAGCARPWVAANNAMVTAVNGATPRIEQLHRADGIQRIDAANGRAEVILQALVDTDRRWGPVWSALRVFAVAQNNVAARIEAGESVSIADLEAPYCAVRAELGDDRNVMPKLGCPE